MKYKLNIVLFFILINCGLKINAQDNPYNLMQCVNKELFLETNFAGQSITLIKESNQFYILRKYFGSGVPVIGTTKYKVKFNSVNQISFSEKIDDDFKRNDYLENFVLEIHGEELWLFLYGLKLDTNELIKN